MLIQKDVKGLNRLPEHLSVILKLEGGKGGAALETLLDEVAEVCAWCACAGIPMLSIYERTGIYCLRMLHASSNSLRRPERVHSNNP